MKGKLNVKKVIIAILIIILLVVSIVVFAISRVANKDDELTETTEIFYDAPNTVSIEMPKKYNLKQSYNSEYLIKLTSDENADIYISQIEKIENRDLSTIARADKMAYLESYDKYSNLSELKELEVNGNRAYTYSFHYLDENLKKAFYIQVILIEIEEQIYIFDIDFPLNDLVLYTNLMTEALSGFRKL